jgi:hypothetical protein
MTLSGEQAQVAEHARDAAPQHLTVIMP